MSSRVPRNHALTPSASHPGRVSPSRRLSVMLAVGAALALLAGCALQDVGSTGLALEAAGFEVHELRLEAGAEVSAVLEHPSEPIEDALFEEAAAIIWEQMDATILQAEIRMRDADDMDRIVTFDAEELQRLGGGE